MGNLKQLIPMSIHSFRKHETARMRSEEAFEMIDVNFSIRSRGERDVIRRKVKGRLAKQQIDFLLFWGARLFDRCFWLVYIPN